MIDVHCHLQEIGEEVWGDGELEAMVCNSTGAADTKRAISLAEKYPRVYAAAGLGYSPDNNWRKELAEIEKLAGHSKVVAVGEIGLDFWESMSEEYRKKQMDLFEAQIEMAIRLQKPVEIHCRNSLQEVYEILQGKGARLDGAVMHCWTGSEDWTRKFVETGAYMSFGGILTFKKSGDLREAARLVPEEMLLVETDAPYVAPEPVRGGKNVPANVKYVVECLAQVRGWSAARTSQITAENARRLFKLNRG